MDVLSVVDPTSTKIPHMQCANCGPLTSKTGCRIVAGSCICDNAICEAEILAKTCKAYDYAKSPSISAIPSNVVTACSPSGQQFRCIQCYVMPAQIIKSLIGAPRGELGGFCSHYCLAEYSEDPPEFAQISGIIELVQRGIQTSKLAQQLGKFLDGSKTQQHPIPSVDPLRTYARSSNLYITLKQKLDGIQFSKSEYIAFTLKVKQNVADKLKSTLPILFTRQITQAPPINLNIDLLAEMIVGLFRDVWMNRLVHKISPITNIYISRIVTNLRVLGYENPTEVQSLFDVIFDANEIESAKPAAAAAAVGASVTLDDGDSELVGGILDDVKSVTKRALATTHGATKRVLGISSILTPASTQEIITALSNMCYMFRCLKTRYDVNIEELRSTVRSWMYLSALMNMDSKTLLLMTLNDIKQEIQTDAKPLVVVLPKQTEDYGIVKYYTFGKLFLAFIHDEANYITNKKTLITALVAQHGYTFKDFLSVMISVYNSF